MPSPVKVTILGLPQTQGETVEGGTLRALIEVRTWPTAGGPSELVDVTTVCSVLDGDGNLTHPTLVHDSTGQYHVDLALGTSGQWRVGVVASGAGDGATEDGFWVASSTFT